MEQENESRESVGRIYLMVTQCTCERAVTGHYYCSSAYLSLMIRLNRNVGILSNFGSFDFYFMPSPLQEVTMELNFQITDMLH